ncbi:MAG: pyridoxal phosphate-dependent aminotransferase [Gammaproteobacteria bacterium]
MDIALATRIGAIKASPTLAITARTAALRAAGHDIIGLGAGEPDFDTPEHIKAAAKAALDQGFTKYTPVDGIAPLKQAIIDKFIRDNGLHYRPEQIIVSCGAKHALFNLMLALLEKGDEVIIPAPYWVSYPDMVLLAEGKPVILETSMESGFTVDPQQLADTITAQTRLLVLNSPSNPTGMCYTRAELAEIGAVLRAHPQVLIVTDDIYEHILWGGMPFSNIVMACPDLMQRTVVINGVSKSYSMTGWRIGYAAGPQALIEAMTTIQSQSTSNPTSIAQVAAQAALAGDQECVREMVLAFEQRHQYVAERLSRLKGVRYLPAHGTFYAFPDMKEALEAIHSVSNDIELAEYLLNEAGVALVPGSAFGAPGHMRLSFATSMENLTQAMDRLEKVLGTH